MRDTDAAPFVALLRDVFGLYLQAKPLNDGQVAMFFRALQRYPLDAVRAALDAHVRDPQRGRFPPLPADVIAQIDGIAANDGRPGPEEAWAIALGSVDERATVVWTREAAQAMQVARPVLANGDEVGARMAFREAYVRLVDEARAAGAPAQWSASEGWDAEGRARAIEQAVELRRLPASALQLLPWPANLALLMAPETGSAAAQAAREQLRQMVEELRNRPDPESADAASRRATDALRRAAAEKVEDYARRNRIALDAELSLADEGDAQRGGQR